MTAVLRPKRLARWLDPHPDLVDVGDRARARVFATMMLVLFPVGMVTITVQLVVRPGFLPSFLSNTLALVLLGACGLVALTRYYRLGAGAAMVLIVLAAGNVGRIDPDDPVWWAYMLIATVAATLLLSMRAAALVAALSAAAVVVVDLLTERTAAQIVGPLMFHLVMSPLLLVVSSWRDRIELVRQDELMLSTRLLEEAQLAARIGHFVLRPGREDVAVSAALRVLLGLDRASLSRAELLARFVEEDRARVDAALFAGATRASRLDVGLLLGDGTRGAGVLAVTATPVAKGVAVVGTLQDLTQRIADERLQASLLSKLHGAQRLETVGRITGGIAHDFNNLLSVVVSTAHLMRATPLSDEGKELLDELDLAVTRASALVAQLNGYARRGAAAGRDDVDVVATARAMSPILRRLVTGTFTLEVPEAAAPVDAERTEIEQLLLNLTTNAADVIPHHGHVTLSVSLGESGAQRGAREVVIRCVDDGPGMSDDVKARIFEPYFTTKADSGGTGLGLATVKLIVDRCRGRVAVASRPGGGATFEIVLPLARAARDVDERDETGARATPGEHLDGPTPQP